MSFAVNKEKTNIEAITLVRLRPRRRLTGWIANGDDPDVYEISWADDVFGLLLNSDSVYLTEASSETECRSTANSFFHDVENAAIFLNSPDNNPNTNFLIVEWDVFVASRDLRWYRDPADSSSGDKFWSGGIVQSPAPTQGNKDLIFGYSPIQITDIQIQVANGFLFKHLHDWSLRGSPIKVWLCLGELKTENISELFVGVAGDMSMDDGILSIDVQDPLRLLDSEYEGETFSSDDFTAEDGYSIEPSMIGGPIREIFGYIPSFLPVNVDYGEEPSTSNNRKWVVSKGTLAQAPVLETLIDQSVGALNDSTNTTVADASYFAFDDDILVDVSGSTKPARITAVDLENNIISHTAVGSRSFSAGDSVYRSFVSQVRIKWTPDSGPEVNVDLIYGRDWSHSDFPNDTRGIILTDNFEANIVSDGLTDFPTFDPALMTLYVKAYGSKILPKKMNGTDDFGSLTANGGTAGHPVVVLWEMLRNRIKTFNDAVTLNETAWSAMALAFDRPIGIAVPDEKNGEFPLWKDVAQRLLQTELLRMHFQLVDGICKLTITQTGMAADGGRELSEENLLNPSFTWETEDIYDKVIMTLNYGEVELAPYSLITPDSTHTYPDSTVEKSPLRAASFLHRVKKTFNFESLFSVPTDDVSLVAWRLAKIVGDRRGTIKATLPREFLEESIDDNASVQLKRLTGFSITGETKTRNYKIMQHQKSAAGVTVILDDQKGIQDSGRWE